MNIDTAGCGSVDVLTLTCKKWRLAAMAPICFKTLLSPVHHLGRCIKKETHGLRRLIARRGRLKASDSLSATALCAKVKSTWWATPRRHKNAYSGARCCTH